jgi:DNA-directed RNA polymerase subunit RPC12/RpoP
MQKPIKFICSSCRYPIRELNTLPQKIFNTAGSHCTRCGHFITKDEIIMQVQDFYLVYFNKSFLKKSNFLDINFIKEIIFNANYFFHESTFIE